MKADAVDLRPWTGFTPGGDCIFVTERILTPDSPDQGNQAGKKPNMLDIRKVDEETKAE